MPGRPKKAYRQKNTKKHVLPRSPRVRKPHDNAVGQSAPLAEVRVQAVLGGRVVEASEEEFSSLIGLIFCLDILHFLAN